MINKAQLNHSYVWGPQKQNGWLGNEGECNVCVFLYVVRWIIKRLYKSVCVCVCFRTGRESLGTE